MDKTKPAKKQSPETEKLVAPSKWEKASHQMTTKDPSLEMSMWVPKTPPYNEDPKNKEQNTSYPTKLAKYSRGKNHRVKLNVGGERHEILWDRLEQYPHTRLGHLIECNSHEEILQLCDDYCLETCEYFFDRQPASFSAILNLYRKDKLHFPEDLCVIDFAEDLLYWGVDELYLDTCCQLKFQHKKEIVGEEIRKDAEFLILHQEDNFGKGCCASFKKYFWELFEKSDTVPQKIIGLLSIFIIVLSISTLSLSTIPELEEFKCRHENENQSICNDILEATLTSSSDSSSFKKLPEEHFLMIENEILNKLEFVCIVWFTFEYIIRLFAAPSKWKFFKGVLNNIDLLAIAPFYISLFLVQFDTPGRLLQVIRVIRILRIFKLARHSTGLQSLGFTLRHSYKNLGVLLLFLSVGVIISSTLAYFAEKDANENGFDSIPTTFWWAVITMTTVGYGDVSPITPLGKFIGALTGICGVVVIALPIPIVVNNFGVYFEEQKRKEKALKRQKAMEIFKVNDSDKFNPPPSYLKVNMANEFKISNGKDKT